MSMMCDSLHLRCVSLEHIEHEWIVSYFCGSIICQTMIDCFLSHVSRPMMHHGYKFPK